MSYQDSLVSASFWQRRAKLLAVKLNFHHWLARVIPLLFISSTLLALFELFRREIALAARWTESLFVLGCAIAMGLAWLQARKHFCTWQEALVRLETVLGLHNRLSAAQAGIVPWPAPPAHVFDGYVQNWKLVAAPLLAAGLFLWAAHRIPVNPMKLGTANDPISEPPEFAQVQSWINTLKAEDLIEPDKLQDMQSSLDKLREHPAQDWYTQSNLEAANSLKELTEQSMNSLAQDLQQADGAVQDLQKKMESSNDPSTLQPMMDAMHQAGDNLLSGNLPLKKELVKPMLGGESSTDKPLSAQQLQQLHDRLQKGALAASTAPKSNGGLSPEMQQALADATNGHGPGRREERPGPGGAGGGKKAAPLELQARDKTTPDGALTPMTNDDMSRASLGETIKVSASEHAVDPSAYRGTQSAGTAQVQGSGGEAVWRSTYDPQEADALARFFK